MGASYSVWSAGQLTYNWPKWRLETGKVVGEYTVEGALGRGGLGTVYRVKHRISHREEAMKVLSPDQTGTHEMAERFRREIQMLASFESSEYCAAQHCVLLRRAACDDDGTGRGRRPAVAEPADKDRNSAVARIMGRRALRALEYAHSRGVVHRDIKPANLMVSPAGLMKVLDFGIAQQESSAELTLAGSVVGSPIYMSPEQVRGGRKATAHSDLYSFGVTMYELIAGEAPIQGRNSYELMMGHLNTVPKKLHEVRPDIPRYISEAAGEGAGERTRSAICEGIRSSRGAERRRPRERYDRHAGSCGELATRRDG